ncbi:hypothetical protein SH661x_002963 [Planctomicrobium sp. SH661]|uniref:hypothetical protein n=1 Tax=Planctomicrobium sp. SH661 TaxID=3448124 RepID=UPI003F5BC641
MPAVLFRTLPLCPIHSRSIVPLLLALTFGVGLPGCGSGRGDAPPKSVTRGKVTYQGKPVEKGMIRFIPVAGPPVQTEIINGEYHVTYKGGVALGTASVEIDGYRETGRMIQVGADKSVPDLEQFLPEKFNRTSSLSVVITDAKLNTHDFLLE